MLRDSLWDALGFSFECVSHSSIRVGASSHVLLASRMLRQNGWACHDAEMHMVHTNEDDGSLLVVGTLMDASHYADNILVGLGARGHE